MARRVSDVLGVTRNALERQGAFDGFTDIDAQFHVDPHLLRETTIAELSTSYSRLEGHFEEILRILSVSTATGDRFYRQAVSMLTFPELRHVKLGYAAGRAPGKGIGPGLASRITKTAAEIVAAGIRDPVIFELVGLLEEDIGADRISDMTLRIVFPDILRFSERVANNLHIGTQSYFFGLERYNVPFDSGAHKRIILVPSEILRDLPVALDWEDIDIVAAYNEELRERINRIIGSTWRQATRHIPKRQLKDVLLRNPELIQDLIDVYKNKTGKQYDFERDPAGNVIWADISKKFADQYPLELTVSPGAAIPVLEVVKAICNHFKRLVEYNGLNMLLYGDSHNIRHERFAQLLFYGIADAYCEANNLDISREPNAGSGPVDFKVSHGYEARVNVEVKYSSNPRLLHGYNTQLPIYNDAERAVSSIYLVIRTSGSDQSIRALGETSNEAIRQGYRAPEIIFVDGRIRPSASRR